MKKDEVERYFNARLKNQALYMGSNYMIDINETVWMCEVWAGGGIWFIKAYNEKNHDYYSKKEQALLRKDTQFQKR